MNHKVKLDGRNKLKSLLLMLLIYYLVMHVRKLSGNKRKNIVERKEARSKIKIGKIYAVDLNNHIT